MVRSFNLYFWITLCFRLDTLPVSGLQTGIFTTDIAGAAAELCGDSGTVSCMGVDISAVLNNKRLCVKLYVFSLYRIVFSSFRNVVLLTEKPSFRYIEACLLYFEMLFWS